jgi:hypothetical protein
MGLLGLGLIPLALLAGNWSVLTALALACMVLSVLDPLKLMKKPKGKK